MSRFFEEHSPTSPSESTTQEAESEQEVSTEVTDEKPLESSADSENSQGKDQDPKEELVKSQDKYLRLAAEFENYKRRAQRDQSNSVRYANESILKNLLPIIDNLERAIQCAKDAETTGPLLEGVELTHKHFLETIGKLGVQQISSAGKPFDPAIHQAVAQVESETAEPNTVLEEFQKGYLLHDRIIRPAMVTVAKEKSDQKEPSSSTEEAGEEGGIRA